MRPVRTIEGVVAPFDHVDVDTDQIIPKQFLKRIERTGYGAFLFYDRRYLDDGSPDPTFILNRKPYLDAPILVAGRNFGCGSSREHAAWALGDFGFRTIVAPSFADIFRNNCYQNGLLPVTLTAEECRHLLSSAQEQPGYRAIVDLESCTVRGVTDGFEASFALDPFRRRCLLDGTDEIDLTLVHEARILEHEESRAGDAPLG